jgi:DNA-directed RNA polymerase subunit N (RpoN/RPB10)
MLRNTPVLLDERLGDEKKTRAILTEWGMDQAAIRRMLRGHRARRASVNQVREEAKVSPALKAVEAMPA